MSTTTTVTTERYGWDRWCVLPSHSETRTADLGIVHFVWKAMFAPHYAVSTVKAAYRSQEDAERHARILTETNTPF
jgi:hypothetical protein